MTVGTRDAAAMTPIIDTPEELTAEWLTGALRAADALDGSHAVASVTKRVVGTGQVGIVVLAELVYDRALPGAPATVIVKLPHVDEGSRRLGMAMGLFETEVRFYQEIAPRLSGLVPGMYWGGLEPETGRFTLVIEDLSSTSEVGDMVAGGTIEEAQLAVGAIAPIQARLWEDATLGEKPWLSRARTEMLFASVPPALDTFVERFADRVEPEHLALAKTLAPKADRYVERVFNGPLVLAHGDFRLDNLMFGRSVQDPQVTVIDWQAVRLGPPLLDVAVYLGSCLPLSERRDREDHLLKAYHDRLVSCGISDFSLAACQASYRASSLYPFLLTITASVMLVQTERGDSMWAQMFDASAAIVVDTGAGALLD